MRITLIFFFCNYFCTSLLCNLCCFVTAVIVNNYYIVYKFLGKKFIARALSRFRTNPETYTDSVRPIKNLGSELGPSLFENREKR